MRHFTDWYKIENIFRDMRFTPKLYFKNKIQFL